MTSDVKEAIKRLADFSFAVVDNYGMEAWQDFISDEKLRRDYAKRYYSHGMATYRADNVFFPEFLKVVEERRKQKKRQKGG